MGMRLLCCEGNGNETAVLWGEWEWDYWAVREWEWDYNYYRSQFIANWWLSSLDDSTSSDQLAEQADEWAGDGGGRREGTAASLFYWHPLHHSSISTPPSSSTPHLHLPPLSPTGEQASLSLLCEQQANCSRLPLWGPCWYFHSIYHLAINSPTSQIHQ